MTVGRNNIPKLQNTFAVMTAQVGQMKFDYITNYPPPVLIMRDPIVKG